MAVADPLGYRGHLRERYSVKLLTPRLISFECDTSEYSPGAATSKDWIQSYNYGLSPFRELSRKDLFRKDACCRLVLSILSLRELVARHYDLEWIERVIDPFEIENFTLANSGLDLYFHQDIPAENIRVEIPYVEIAQLVRPDSPLGSLVKSKVTVQSDDTTLRCGDLRQLASIAIASYTKVINYDSKNALAYYRRGKWYQMLDRTAVAKADFAKAEELGYPVPKGVDDSNTD
jgi:hypothetical protein